MSKIEREMIAEARAARQRQEEAMRRCASDCAVPCSACLMPPDAVWVSAADIGADVPSAPNDEQADETPWWTLPQYHPVETPAKAPYPSEFLDALVYAVAERLAKGAPVESPDVPPLCREDDADKTRSAVNLLECYGWRWEHGVWQVPNA